MATHSNRWLAVAVSQQELARLRSSFNPKAFWLALATRGWHTTSPCSMVILASLRLACSGLPCDDAMHHVVLAKPLPYSTQKGKQFPEVSCVHSLFSTRGVLLINFHRRISCLNATRPRVREELVSGTSHTPRLPADCFQFEQRIKKVLHSF